MLKIAFVGEKQIGPRSLGEFDIAICSSDGRIIKDRMGTVHSVKQINNGLISLFIIDDAGENKPEIFFDANPANSPIRWGDPTVKDLLDANRNLVSALNRLLDR